MVSWFYLLSLSNYIESHDDNYKGRHQNGKIKYNLTGEGQKVGLSNIIKIRLRIKLIFFPYNL